MMTSLDERMNEGIDRLIAKLEAIKAREEIHSILRDERLIDVCPKFVREDY
jgi:hypothetical protein